MARDQECGDFRSLLGKLREFVRAMYRRPDVEVTRALIGNGVDEEGAGALARIDPELADLYRAFDGAHVEWRFIDGTAEGRLHILPAADLAFLEDAQVREYFDPNQQVILFDAVQAKAGGWLVCDGDTGTSQIVFGNCEDACGIAGSIAEYLRQGLESGFVLGWPFCQDEFDPSLQPLRDAIQRIRNNPEHPPCLRPGARVQCAGYLHPIQRGEVLDIREVSPQQMNPVYGRRLVKVRLDEGAVLWFSERAVHEVLRQDAYERMRAPQFLWSRAVRVPLLILEDLTRAIGAHKDLYISHDPHGRCILAFNAQRVAALFTGRPFDDVVTFVLDLHQALLDQGLDLNRTRELDATGMEFLSGESCLLWPQGMLIQLRDGLVWLAHVQSAQRQIPACRLLGAPVRERLLASPQLLEGFRTGDGDGDGDGVRGSLRSLVEDRVLSCHGMTDYQRFSFDRIHSRSLSPDGLPVLVSR